ncbi:DUF357 domain-containing protein [Candidatus Woesearchaeota archaeon]|nr:DUF357 domain-containing protein [Candidatus Woesearchaeota archaeon]
MKEISRQKLEKYFDVTGRAIAKAEKSGNRTKLLNAREEILDMAKRYYSDAKYFFSKDDFVNSFACLNYAHGWLDAGARLGIFDVDDTTLFAAERKK